MPTSNRLILLALSLGFLTVTLDSSALSVALPSLGRSFHSSLAGLQWVSNAYILAYAGCILSAGRFADRFGARVMLTAGVALLALTSLLCAFSPVLAFLVAVRFAQGIAGAILTTSSYKLLAHTFGSGPERGKAFATLNFAGTIGLASGPVVGGLLVQSVSWRSIFLLNVIVAGVLFGVLRRVENQLDSASLSPDAPGQLFGILTLTALAVGLIQGSPLAIVLALVVGVCFVVVEHKSNDAMLPLAIFQNHSFSAGAIVIGLWRASLYGVLFFLGIYFQSTLHYGSAKSGLAIFPITAGMLFTNMLSAPLTNRFGIRMTAVSGMLLTTAGGALLLAATTTTPYAFTGLCLVLLGAGAGWGIPAVGNAALSSTANKYAGVASGVYNSGGQTGSLIGVAIIGGFASEAGTTGLHHTALIITIGLAAATALCYRYLPK